MRGAIVDGRQAGAGLLHQFVEGFHLVIVKAIGEGSELDFSHVHTVPQPKPSVNVP